MTDKFEIIPGYKTTKLGWIPEDWSITTIGSIAKVKGGKRLPRGKRLVKNNTGYPYIKAGDLKNGTVLTNQIEYLPPEIYVQIKNYTIDEGDVYITIVGANIGDVGVVPAEMHRANLTENAAKIYLLRGVTNLFLVYFLGSNYGRHQISFSIGAGAQPKLGLNKIEAIKIPLPSLSEQQKIAAILSTWDKALELTQSLIKAKEKQKKGLMQSLLTGKVRLPGFEGEWREVKLGDVFMERKERGFDNLELLSIGSDGVYPQSKSNKKDNSNSDKSKYKRICPGDIGYNTMRMWQGRSAVSRLQGIVSPAYTIVTPKKGIDVNFMGSLFHLPKTIHSFWRYSQGLVGDTLNCKFPSFALVKVKIPPTYEEQVAVSKILKTADDEIDLLQQKLKNLREQKKGLMQQLLTGKTRVNVS